ncbi:hypothetical protein MMC27_005636 [Xylographa pallens]|nr:hypothetical protein [Xylographa pallens]
MDHIVHHLLALWALGASPGEIQDMWEYNKPYQAPIEGNRTAVSVDLDLKDPVLFDKCLGNNDCYADFLRFFEDEVARKGVPDTVREYILKGYYRANDIFCRMYTGELIQHKQCQGRFLTAITTDLVHPIIHLGCAIEFQQPSLVAEALAAACVHDNWPKEFLLPTEEYVRSNTEVPSRTLLQIIDSLRSDPEMTSAVKDSDPFNEIPDGFLKRVTAKQLAPYLGQFQVKPTPEDLQCKMTEMMQSCAYMMGAAQRPGKCEAIDFVLLHNATLSIFYPAILAQDWLSDHEKSRLLEAKARVDAVMYAGCGSPALYPMRIVDYVPRRPKDGWEELFHRSIVYRDEGHAAKLIRSLFSLEKLSETAPDFPIVKSDFAKIAHMAMDSIERAFETGGHKMPENVAEATVQKIGHGGEMVVSNQIRWVFYGGLDRAWDYVPDLEISALESH